MNIGLSILISFSLSFYSGSKSTLDQFKEKISSYVSKCQYGLSSQMPVKRFEGNSMLNTDLQLFMTDPVTKLKYYPDIKVIIDEDGFFIYDLKSNLIFDLESNSFYQFDDFSDDFRAGRNNLLKN